MLSEGNQAKLVGFHLRKIVNNINNSDESR